MMQLVENSLRNVGCKLDTLLGTMAHQIPVVFREQNKTLMVAIDMTQQLRAIVALVENLGLVSSPNMVLHSHYIHNSGSKRSKSLF